MFNLFKKRKKKDQVYLFKIDWDKVETLDDLKHILSNNVYASYFYGTVTDIRKHNLLKYVEGAFKND